jgi:anaerobic ribonucleoside-triphosphate reductase activating protein
MRLAGIVRDSIVDGEGIRDVIFFQGCSHRCKGCHNPHTWNYEGGEHRFLADVVRELSESSNDVTISGGEPLDQADSLIELVKELKKQGKNIWMYTGNTVDPTKRIYYVLARYIDVVVDGKFVEELKDPNLRFVGSSNQRVIDLPKSVEERKIVLWEES